MELSSPRNSVVRCVNTKRIPNRPSREEIISVGLIRVIRSDRVGLTNPVHQALQYPQLPSPHQEEQGAVLQEVGGGHVFAITATLPVRGRVFTRLTGRPTCPASSSSHPLPLLVGELVLHGFVGLPLGPHP